MFGMSRVGVAAAGFVLVLGAGSGAAYLYFFSGLRTAPKPLTLTSPSPTTASAPRSVTPTPATNALAGQWTVGPSPEARYRVRETVAGVGAHEAVASTADVSGGLTTQSQSGALLATSIKFVVKLTNLHSIDQLAGYNVSNRDRAVSQALSVQQFPDATFEASAVSVPAGIDGGGPVDLSVPGRLTIHGTTHDVEAHLQARMNGQQLALAGSVQFNMTDYGITPPRVAFAAAEPQVTIEIQVVLVKG
jgi:polyisoprenoid-binding protein YceI